MPVLDDKHSGELVFSNFDHPLYLHPYMELRVWFGEDLRNWSESDNQGRACVDVFVYQCWRVSRRRELTSSVLVSEPESEVEHHHAEELEVNKK